VATLGACSAGGQSGPLSSRVRSWVQDTALGQAVGTLFGDSSKVTTAVRRRLGSGVVHTVCLVLFQDAASAAGNLPSPDPRLTALLEQAYDAMGRGAHDCYDAGAGDSPLQRRSARERARAAALLDQALTRVRAVTGAPVPTTTTTAPGGGLFG